MFSVDVERAHAPLGSVSSRWEGIRRPVRRHAVERRPAQLLRGSGLMRTDLGPVQPPFRRTPEGTHRQKRRLWRGRAQRGSTCGSRPLTPAVPERLGGRLWPVAKKRNEYGTRAQEGKDTAPRRRMFIGHEPVKGIRAACRESKQGGSEPLADCAPPPRSPAAAGICYDLRVCFIISSFLESSHGHQCQHPRPPPPDRAA